ncbi:hypothetical protein [Sphingomonas jaspsi]|uniref:hypothetical protein n=1 Tax=Sphingomonas jaspsi TaxID=392409 RepID=UPI0004B5BC8C|nr:hypothetical protein [Sphingomonas jaspsi]
MFDLEQQAWDLGYHPDEAPLAAWSRTDPRPIVQPGFEFPVDVWRLMGACYTVFFSAMAGLAAGSGTALFMVVISALYTLIYFGTGCVLARLAGPQARSPLEQGVPLETWTGPMERGAVYGQVLIVPFGIAAFGMAVMLIAWAA